MRKVSVRMGMPISIDLPSVKGQKYFDALFAIGEEIDERFSPYKSNSELAKLWRGQIREKDASKDMQAVIQACNDYEQITNGYFSPRYAGTFNPTGYVKGWAIQQMADYLDSHGIDTYLINVAGDIVAKSKHGHSWDIVIANPVNTAEPIATIKLDNGAIATSGNYERGTHIYDPHTKLPADELASVTIIGPSIIPVDVYATAVFAMSHEKGSEFMKKQRGFKAVFITKDGTVLAV
ncbi:MAG: FAD:protein FMN transferase [Candidatus Saccharimonadales bacterium]